MNTKRDLIYAEKDIVYYIEDENIENFEDVDFLNYLCDTAVSYNPHDVLLATGGPSYGVTLVNGTTPCVWALSNESMVIREINDPKIFSFWKALFKYLHFVEGLS